MRVHGDYKMITTNMVKHQPSFTVRYFYMLKLGLRNSLAIKTIKKIQLFHVNRLCWDLARLQYI